MRYLNWGGFESVEFNVGSYRRKIGLASADSNFFAANNADAKRVRDEMAMAVQESMYAWIKDTSSNKRRVAIFDATNTTISRRKALAKKARSEKVFLLFIESICDDPKVLQQNYKLKLANDDYKDVDGESALKDFVSRVEAYEQVYEPIQDDEDNERISYVKMINVGQKVITRNCTGYLPSQVALYLSNLHINPRKIYLSLNAELETDHGDDPNRPGPVVHKIRMGPKGGSTDGLSKHLSANSLQELVHGNASATTTSQSPDSPSSRGIFDELRRRMGTQSPSSDYLGATADMERPRKLTEAGKHYTHQLARYLEALYGHGEYVDQTSPVKTARRQSIAKEEEDDITPGAQLMTLTGTATVHADSIVHLRTVFKCYNTPLLNELRGGDLQGYRMSDIKHMFPEEYKKRKADKLNYRYPGAAGESYRDVIERLRPIIVELERQRHSVLVVCHMAVLRCIYAYFMDIALEDIPHLDFEKHALYELTPGPFGCLVTKRNPGEEMRNLALR
jgi:broad specificity phosphatase PhoE